MLTQALILGAISGIAILDERIFGTLMLGRPLVTGTLVGIVLGDPITGVKIGAQLELIWMGIAGIGAATPPDVVTGGVLGTAFAMLSGQGVEVALALAVPIAVLAQSLGVLTRIVNLYFSKRADGYARRADFRGVALMLWIPAVIFFLSTFVPTFLAILLGADKVSGFIHAIPAVVLDGLGVAGNLLPAIGLALLMDMLLSKRMAVFFFVGFFLAAYLGLDITAVAIFGACIAVVLNLYATPRGGDTSTGGKSGGLLEGEIDFE